MSQQATCLPIFPERVRVQDRRGALLFWAREATARRLLSEGRVRILATRRRVHGVEVLDRGEVAASPSAVTRPRYSHNREVPELVFDYETGRFRKVHPLNANPRGVWTLKHIPSECRAIYRQVQTDCCAA